MGTGLKNLLAIINASIERNTQYIEPRIMVISIIAVIGFPLYYVIWKYIFPQPYENLELRLLGAALFIPSIFVKHWPQWLVRYKSIYWYFATLYTLPFFFVYMLLMNNGSGVWLSSALVAIFIMLIWLDWINIIAQSVIGVLAAWIVFILTSENHHISLFTLEQVPVYLFAIIVGIATNFSSEMLRQERQRAMLVAASNIAHELRTPLLGIRSGAAGLRQYLPSLLNAYQLARNKGLAVESIRQVHLHSMFGVLERMESEASHSNTIIDMLLMNARTNGFAKESITECSMKQCVNKALRRYPFANERERQLVLWNENADFLFRGNELFMVHVLFNLLKNSLYHIAKVNKGDISISLRSDARVNQLIFRDTGSGVPPEALQQIFTRFNSWSLDEESIVGAGIGLAFCQSVMLAWGGSIICNSELGKYTEFILTFPGVSKTNT